MNTAALCTKIDRFFSAVQDAGFELCRNEITPQTSAQIQELEKSLEIVLPDSFKEFLTNGVLFYTGASSENPFASLGFEFLDCESILSHTRMLRELAPSDETDGHSRIIRNGAAVTFEEPEIVLSSDGVYHFSFRNPPLRIADSFEEFLFAYGESGCFSSHNFYAHWEKVRNFVESSIPLDENSWVQAYLSRYGDNDQAEETNKSERKKWWKFWG